MIQVVPLDRLTALELLALLRNLAHLGGGRPPQTLQHETKRLRQALEDAIAEADRQQDLPL